MTASPRKLRVLLMGPMPPPVAGMSKFGLDMLSGSLAREHELVSLRDDIPFHWRPRAPTDGYTYNIVRRDGVAITMRVLDFVARKMRELDRLLRDRPVDVFHVLSTAGLGFYRNAVHIRIARRRGARTVFHLLGQIDDHYHSTSPFGRRLISLALDGADAHIVQSPRLAEFLRGITRRPVWSILNGVDVDAFAPGPNGFSESGDPSCPVVLSVGVLGEKKGTFDLLEALARLRTAGVRFSARFVGAGDVDLFRGIAEKKGLGDIVRFLGPVDEAQKVSLLRSADVFALPSRAEGLPLALLEAMAAGLPIVSTRVGAIPEVVAVEGGTLLAPGDIEGLVHELGALLADARRRMLAGRFNAREAHAKYRVDRVMAQISDVWRGLTQ